MSRDTPVPITALADIAGRYDGFIFDLWGVVHDGLALRPGIGDLFRRLRRRQGPVMLLSNAPRRLPPIIAKLDGFGLPRTAYDDLLSSGEATHQALKAGDVALGQRFYHLGPDRDRDVAEGLPFEEVFEVGAADFILNTGPLGYDDRVNDYDDLLKRGLAKGLPMICANPDLLVHIGPQVAICAGAIAQAYEEAGGPVRRYGKPEAGIFKACVERLGVAPDRTLMIGDNLHTDIKGANAAGLDSVLVADGIHREALIDPNDGTLHRPGLDGLMEATKATPSYVIAGLR